MTVSIFVCNHGQAVVLEHCQCGVAYTKRCTFKLKGRMAGHTCGKPLCTRCATPQSLIWATPRADAPGLCGPHARLVARLVREAIP